jgi:hypothetical protein
VITCRDLVNIWLELLDISTVTIKRFIFHKYGFGNLATLSYTTLRLERFYRIRPCSILNRKKIDEHSIIVKTGFLF